jgi:hypothetical protein
MDFSELHQYFNDFSSAIRQIADKTGNAVYDVKVEVGNLVSALNTTNFLLGVIACLLLVNTVMKLIKKKDQ